MLEVLRKNRNKEAFVFITEKELEGSSKELEAKLRKGAQRGFFYIEIPAVLKTKLMELYSLHIPFIKTNRLERHRQLHNWIFMMPKKHKRRLLFAKILTGASIQKMYNYLPAHFFLQHSNFWEKFFLLFYHTCPKGLGKHGENCIRRTRIFSFSFNHYRPEKKMFGVMLTRLAVICTLVYRQTGPLRQNQYSNKWQASLLLAGYFVLILGKFLELL